MRDESVREREEDTIVQATIYIRNNGGVSRRRVFMVVQDLLRQSEMRKGLLKAIHGANG